MLSVQQCRKILGNGCSITDHELEELRNQIYALANVTASISPNQFRAQTKPPSQYLTLNLGEADNGSIDKS